MSKFCACLKLLLIFVVFGKISFASTTEKSRETDSSSSSTYCEGADWIAFKDEKCFKLITKWATREEGKVLCSQESLTSDSSTPQLVSIKSSDEQVFLTKLIFETTEIEDNVWIGAKRLPGDVSKFVWDDGTDIEFFDWADGSPAENVAKECVVMQSMLTKNVNGRNSNGKWRDVTCKQGNYVICEKLQRWSFGKLQQSLLEERKARTRKQEELSNSLNLVNQKLEETERELSNTQFEFDQSKKNPVPIGFIYVQLSSQPVPKTLWPTVEWADVTSEYAGLFFRAEGGGSAQFEVTQEATCPKLAQIRSEYGENPEYEVYGGAPENIYPGQWSRKIFSGCRCPQSHSAMLFYVTADEVRPRNKAMRIWKRIK